MNTSNGGGRSILVVAVHKGASSFIADEFSAAVEKAVPKLPITRVGSRVLLGTPIEEMALPATNAMFVRVYPSDLRELVEEEPSGRPFENTKMVLLYRDPRDAAVSMYYSTAYSHSLDVRNPERLLATRERLQNTPVRDGVEQLASLPIREFKAIRNLARDYPDAYVSSYEHLVGDYATWLRGFCQHVGFSDDVEQRLYNMTARSFDPPSEEDPSQHKRRITPGNWREVFDDELTDMFKAECGTEMEEAGYTW